MGGGGGRQEQREIPIKCAHINFRFTVFVIIPRERFTNTELNPKSILFFFNTLYQDRKENTLYIRQKLGKYIFFFYE